MESVRITWESINEFARAHTSTSVVVTDEIETEPPPTPSSVASDSSEGISGIHNECDDFRRHIPYFNWKYRARNSGLPMAKWQAKFEVWQAKTTMNCQMDNKMTGEIYWTGFVTFSSHSMLLYKFLFLAGQNK
jgi:hypothetical protein